MGDRQKILVTGATSGLGREVATQLSAAGHDVLACGRRADRLSALSQENPRITHQTLDLSSSKDISDFCKTAPALSGVILNAGITYADLFTSGDFETDASLVQTNILANLQLIRALLPNIKAHQGRILIVASLGGLAPLPYQSVYAGTKAFMVNFGLSLREELKHEGVQVTVFAPGGIKTEMTDIPAMKALEKDLAPVEDVAKAALNAYEKMPAILVPGVQNKLIAGISKIAPREFMSAQAEKIYRKAREKNK